MAYGARNLIELKVGRKYSLRVQLHLPTCDVDWFNESAVDHLSQLLSLISREILPVEFKEDIDNPFRSHNSGTQTDARKIAPSKLKANNNSKAAPNTKKRKASGNASEKTGKVFKRSKKKNAKVTKTLSNKKEEGKKTYISGMETKFLFGETIQLTYQVKSIQNSHRATLTYVKSESRDKINNDKERNKKSSGSAILSKFKSLHPLPKLLVIWCYPFDPLHPKQPTMDTVDGFPRPEFIPISSLFKER